MIRIIILALAILFLGTALLNAAERPLLRAEAVVTGSLVRVGDLVENAGIVADAPIFRAPALGETGSVGVAQVLEALRAHSLIGLDPGSITEVSVTRASRAIPVQEIEALLATAIGKDYSLGDGRDVTIALDRALRTVQVEPSVTALPRVAQLRLEIVNEHPKPMIRAPLWSFLRSLHVVPPAERDRQPTRSTALAMLFVRLSLESDRLHSFQGRIQTAW